MNYPYTEEFKNKSKGLRVTETLQLIHEYQSKCRSCGGEREPICGLKGIHYWCLKCEAEKLKLYQEEERITEEQQAKIIGDHNKKMEKLYDITKQLEGFSLESLIYLESIIGFLDDEPHSYLEIAKELME